MIEERSTVFYMSLIVATCTARSLDGQQNFEHDQFNGFTKRRDPFWLELVPNKCK